MNRYFNMFVNFGRVFFSAPLAGFFLRMLIKQARICTSNRMALCAINDKFDEWKPREVIIFRAVWTSSLSYHKSSLLLIAQGTMQLLINHQLIPILIQSKSISLSKSFTKDLKALL